LPVASAATVNLTIDKRDDGATYAPGSPITYTIVVTNEGPAAVVGARVVDTFPPAVTGATWTCDVNPVAAGNACAAVSGVGNINTTVDLLAGATATFTIDATIAPDAAGLIINTATVTPPDGVTESNPDDNQDTTSNGPEVDLAIVKDDFISTYTPGQATTYTITVTNNGPDAVFGAVVTDILPAVLTGATWTCAVDPVAAGNACGAASGSGSIATTVDLQPGARAVFTLRATISGSASGDITNVARVDAPAGVTDTNPSNNQDDDTNTQAGSGGGDIGTADPAIVKLGDPSLALPGEIVRWIITVTNNGTGPATNVVITDTVPDPFIVIGAETPVGTFTITGQTVTFFLGTLNPGQSVTVVIVTRVRDDIVPPISVTNEAALTWDGGTRRTATGTVRVVRQELPATGQRRAAGPVGLPLEAWAVGGISALAVLGWLLRRRMSRG
jgi:uncharacterized repeat protein (TIGR01451 family)